MVKISMKAWRAYEGLRNAIERSAMNDLRGLAEKSKKPEILADLREAINQRQYENFLKWETVEMLGGLLEMGIAIQDLMNKGMITVMEAETEASKPV